MFQRRILACAITALLLTGAALAQVSVTRAADDILMQVPKSAWAVVIVNRLDTTSGLAEKIGGQLNVPVFNPLGLLKVLTRIEGGLDDQGAAAIAFLPDPDGGPMPIAVGYLPVTNYDTFIEHLVVGDKQGDVSTINLAGQQLLVSPRGKYAVLAQPGREAILTATVNAKEDAMTVFAPLAAWMSGNEIVVVATADGVRAATAGMTQGLAQAKTQMADAGSSNEAAVAWFDEMEKLLGDIRTQVSLAGVGIDASNDGHLTTSIRTTFGPGSWAQAASTAMPAAAPPLTGLADAPFALALAPRTSVHGRRRSSTSAST